jgi:hypothetical protein
MGLLRKAAGAAARGEEQEAEHPYSEAPAAAPSGLLKKLIAFRGSGPVLGVELPSVALAPAPEDDLLSAAPATLDEALADIEIPTGTEIPVVELVEEPAPALSLREVRVSRPTEEVTAEILSAIASLPQSVEVPSQLFSLLVTRLSISKGALLLFDPLRSVYAPWASVGYDQTTLHRMRIPLGANASFNALANGAPLALEGAAQVSPYQQYYSSREFSSLGRLLLAPFISEEKLIGVLLVTEASPPVDGDADLLACLGRITSAGARILQQAREEKLSRAGTQGLRPGASPDEQVSRFLSGLTPGTQVLFLGLSLSEYAKTLAASHEHLDPFRLSEDLGYFLGAFVADLGIAIPLRQGHALVGLLDLEESELDLFLHQLTAHLRGLFGGNGAGGPGSGPRVTATSTWPDDGADVRDLIEHLSA